MDRQHDGAEMVVRSNGITLRAIRESAREADFVASTDAVDSYDEIVEQTWDLERFSANPVVLFAHNSRALPIGQCTRCEVVNGALECTIRFASAEANPEAERVWKLVQEKVLRAVSVGFMPGSVRLEKRDGKDVYVLANNELREISVTPVGANPEALAKMKAKALAEASTEKTSATTRERNNEMDVEQKLKDAETSAKDASARADALDLANKTLVTERDAAVKKRDEAIVERDAAVARAKAADDLVLEREVDALVGKKIDPAQKAHFLKMAQLDRSVFDGIVAGLPTKSVIEEKSVIGTDPQGTNEVTTTTDNGAGLATLAANLGNAA